MKTDFVHTLLPLLESSSYLSNLVIKMMASFTHLPFPPKVSSQKSIIALVENSLGSTSTHNLEFGLFIVSRRMDLMSSRLSRPVPLFAIMPYEQATEW